MSAAVTLAARRLRRSATTAERVLWARLRNRQVAGAKVRRQAPIGPFIVDFLVPEARLVIELDGGQHDGFVADVTRDVLLEGQGLHVVRYWNHEVLGNMDGVLAEIARLIIERRASRPLTPTLSPAGRVGPARNAIAPTDAARRPDRIAPSPRGGEGRGEGASPSPSQDRSP